MVMLILPIGEGKARCKGGNAEPLYGSWVFGGRVCLRAFGLLGFSRYLFLKVLGGSVGVLCW
jgi:hypothetical protein